MGRKKILSDDALLSAARKVFVEQGAGASTKEIARQAGISEGVIFQRFVTKNELFFAAMIPPLADVSRLLKHPRLKGRSLIEKLTLSLLAYFRSTLPVLIPLMSHPSFRFDEFARRHPDSPMGTLRRQLVELIVNEQGEGRIGPVDPGAAALAVWSAAHTIALVEHMGAHGGRLEPRIVKELVRCMWEGFAPRT